MADRTLTILELTASGDTAGATRSIAELSRGLKERGHRVILGARPQSYIYRTLGLAGIETIPFRFHRKYSLADARRVAHVARDRNVDVVNAHASKDRYAAILAKLAFGMKARVVVTRRVMPSSGGGALQGWFYAKGSDRIVAVSDAVREALVASGTPRGSVVTIPNGLPRARFDRPNPGPDPVLAKELALPGDGRPVLGVVSRLKDQADVLRALPMIGRPATVVFVGIQRTPALQRLEEELDAGHAVRYVPFAWDVLPYYGLLDLSILPSRIEGLSQTLLESMALGIPVVASRAGGNTDVLRHGENGLFYEPQDPKDLAAQIVRILDDAPLRARIVDAARVTATVDFSLERTIERTEELYRSLVNGRE